MNGRFGSREATLAGKLGVLQWLNAGIADRRLGV
jgi:hypothetical protein